jgi:hypothetical protein
LSTRDPRLLILLFLAVLTIPIVWFDYAAIAAVFHPAPDLAGNLNFQVPGYSNSVYPFTYVGAAASVIGVAYFVYRTEARPPDRTRAKAVGVALGLLVGNLASVGMINCYEQVFLLARYFTPQGHAASVYWFGLYFDEIRNGSFTLFGMAIVLTVLPWCRRSNWPGVATFSGLYLAGMLLWLHAGVGGPLSGNALDYGMNAFTRITSQLILVAAVAPQDLIRRLAQSLSARIAARSAARLPPTQSAPAPVRLDRPKV